ncbi:MAG: epoxyqueuosine reductase QueH [Candidatus Cloacimonetes bacterium]|nr:epoxyqueuosine reductase QueH [Candidatus Cloacimonadota bacterium]
MKRILMHLCCAPCFIMPFYRLKDKYELTGFWNNFNIHPVTEYTNRLGSVRDFIKMEKIQIIERDEYGLVKFLNKTMCFYGENEKAEKDIKLKRCFQCYYDRLETVAIYAKSNKYDFFSTSLLYSKRQNHELIKEIGFSLVEKYGINFFYEDFRKYWQDGIALSKEKNLYRQKYCGCIFSEMERYLDRREKC